MESTNETVVSCDGERNAWTCGKVRAWNDARYARLPRESEKQERICLSVDRRARDWIVKNPGTRTQRFEIARVFARCTITPRRWDRCTPEEYFTNKNGHALDMLLKTLRRSFRFELLGRARAFFHAWTFIEDCKHCAHASPRCSQSVFPEFRVEKPHVHLKWLRLLMKRNACLVPFSQR